jgi:GcrA cell cycle regulator
VTKWNNDEIDSDIRAFVTEEIALGRAGGNLAIRQRLLSRYQIQVTPGQIAGVVHRLGIGRSRAGEIIDQEIMNARKAASLARLQAYNARELARRAASAERAEEAAQKRVAKAVARAREREETIQRAQQQRSRRPAAPGQKVLIASAVARSLTDRPTLAALPSVVSGPGTQTSSTPVRYTRQCVWPIGDPGTKDFRFCDVPTDRTYCPEHHKIAHA